MNITLQEKLLRAAHKRAAAQPGEECPPKPPSKARPAEAPPAGRFRSPLPGLIGFRVRLLLARIRLWLQPGQPSLPAETPGQKPATPRLLARLLARFQQEKAPGHGNAPGPNGLPGSKTRAVQVKVALPAASENRRSPQEEAPTEERTGAKKPAPEAGDRREDLLMPLSVTLEKAESLLMKAQARYQELDRRVAQEVASRLDPERLQNLLPAKLQEILQHLAPLYERMAALILMANLPWLKPQARAKGARAQKHCQCMRDRHGRRIVCWACQLGGEDE